MLNRVHGSVSSLPILARNIPSEHEEEAIVDYADSDGPPHSLGSGSYVKCQTDQIGPDAVYVDLLQTF